MSYQVRLIFRGLCGFVPSADWESGDGLDWVGVLLVNAGDETREELCVRLPPHFPFMRIKARFLEGQLAGGLDEFFYFPLVKKDIVFKADIGGYQKVRVNMGRRGRRQPDPNVPGQELFFDWMADMNEVRGKECPVSACLGRAPDDSKVVARIHLTAGLLEAHKLGKYDGELIVSQFDPPPPVVGAASAAKPVAHALPRSVSLMIDQVSGAFVIYFKPFDGGHRREVVIRAEDGETVEIEVLNMCLADLFEGVFSEGVSPDVGRLYPGPDPDFGWFQVLDDDFDPEQGFRADLPIPVAVEFSITEGAGGREPAICTGTRLMPPTQDSLNETLGLVSEIASS